MLANERRNTLVIDNKKIDFNERDKSSKVLTIF